jgi:hypothetical protein
MRLGLGISICSSVSVPATPFTPASDANLKAWYEMGLGATVVSGNLTALADQSGTGDANKNLAKAGTGSIIYTSADTSFNNQASAFFNTTLRLEGTAWASQLAQPFAVYTVGKITNQGGRIVDGTTGGRILIMNDAGLWGMYAGLGFIDAAGSDPTVASKVCAVFNGASSAIYVGGTFATAAGTGNAGPDPLKLAVIGDLSGGGGGMLGYAAAVIVSAGAPDATTRARYAAYLETKFGV